MALTLPEQELMDFAVGSLPQWVRTQDEFLTAAAKMFGLVRTQIEYLFGQALITTSTGATGSTPDWLNQHARDRDTSRQHGETDPALQQRLRVVPDALTRQAILDAANAILAAAGVVGSAALLELPRDGAWLGRYTAMSGIGASILTANPVELEPVTLPWPTPPWISPSVFPSRRSRITLTGATDPLNNGTFEIVGLDLDGNAVQYVNVLGGGGFDPIVHWKVEHMDGIGNVTDGFARSFCGRGWRMSTPRPLKILVILPFGTTPGVLASVLESLRTKKAAGFQRLVEARQHP